MKNALIIISLFILGCTNKSANIENQKDVALYGEALQDGEVISVSALNERLAAVSSDSISITVTGTVTDVCKNKGCWMKLDLENGETMHVTFKDYGFLFLKTLKVLPLKFKVLLK